MSERPILFSGPMVRAILEGRKTQTRRVVRWPLSLSGSFQHLRATAVEVACGDEAVSGLRCPYGFPGDRLWVREMWRPRVSANGHSRGVEYSADGRMSLTEMPSGIFNKVTSFIPLHLWAPSQHAEMKAFCDRWRPSIHMPRWASRLTLEVVGLRVERLNEISEADAVAEGIEFEDDDKDAWRGYLSADRSCLYQNARRAFEDLWDSINAAKHPWSSNPFVWVVDFKRIDARKGGAE